VDREGLMNYQKLFEPKITAGIEDLVK
jgi:hypothetical protein